MVMSGFRFVTHTSGRKVPPPATSCPAMSLCIVYFVVSKLFTTKFTMLLCLHVHLPVSSDNLHLKGYQNCIIVESKVTAILLNGWILPIGGVASARVCAQPTVYFGNQSRMLGNK